jgi:hypothetical protein
VPLEIKSWADVEEVVRQAFLEGPDAQGFDARYLFGFFLGILIGDANKSKQGRGHRHVDLTLSKKYETNIRIGEFTCVCAKSFGLRMERKKDLPKPADKPNGFYVWTSILSLSGLDTASSARVERRPAYDL